MTLAAIRPDSVNLPLFVHVFGAMVLVGGLLVTSTASFVAAAMFASCGSATRRCSSSAFPATS